MGRTLIKVMVSTSIKGVGKGVGRTLLSCVGLVNLGFINLVAFGLIDRSIDQNVGFSKRRKGG